VGRATPSKKNKIRANSHVTSTNRRTRPLLALTCTVPSPRKACRLSLSAQGPRENHASRYKSSQHGLSEFDLVSSTLLLPTRLRQILHLELCERIVETERRFQQNMYAYGTIQYLHHVTVGEVFSHQLGLMSSNLKLQIECTCNTAVSRDCTDPAVLYNNPEVCAEHL
jgi:hypothetical protein